jgi:hypothetical protein
MALLDPEQQATWRDTRTFRVDTAWGEFELGRMFDIGFRSRQGDVLRLCVVPADHGRGLPEPDIWANLLLALHHDPRWFLNVANWRKPGGPWMRAPVPNLDRLWR